MSFKKHNFDKKELIPIFIIISMFAVAFYIYPMMPEEMPIHWDSEGNIDGYGSRFVGLFLLPITALIIYIILYAIPFIAVYKENIKSFYFYYFGFKLVFILFMIVLYTASLLPNFGIDININYIIMPIITIMLFSAGLLMEKSKRNYFIGFRTPWTLSSDRVWNKTNKLAGKGFKIISLLFLISIFLGRYGLFIPIIILIIFSLLVMVYSYRISKEKN